MKKDRARARGGSRISETTEAIFIRMAAAAAKTTLAIRKRCRKQEKSEAGQHNRYSVEVCIKSLW